VQLFATWDERHPATATLEGIAERLGRFVADRYGLADLEASRGRPGHGREENFV
jgi:hypothetical protein